MGIVEIQAQQALQGEGEDHGPHDPGPTSGHDADQGDDQAE